MSTSDRTAGPVPIALPVWRLVVVSFASVFHHPGNFAGRIWPWVAISCGLAIVLGNVLDVRLDLEDPQRWEKEQWVVLGVMSVPVIAGSFMVVVNWHRGLLLGEAGGAVAAFRFDWPLWRYVGVSIKFVLLLMVALIPFAIVGGVLVATKEPASDNQLLHILPFLAALPISARYLLAFPMAAVGAKSPLLRGSWRLTRGNTWRLTGVLLITQIFGQALSYGIDAALGFLLGVTGLQTQAVLILQPINTIVVLLGVALAASLASYAYAVLTNHPLGREVTG